MSTLAGVKRQIMEQPLSTYGKPPDSVRYGETGVATQLGEWDVIIPPHPVEDTLTLMLTLMQWPTDHDYVCVTMQSLWGGAGISWVIWKTDREDHVNDLIEAMKGRAYNWSTLQFTVKAGT